MSGCKQLRVLKMEEEGVSIRQEPSNPSGGPIIEGKDKGGTCYECGECERVLARYIGSSDLPAPSLHFNSIKCPDCFARNEWPPRRTH